MFVEIEKINSHKETGKALIKTEDIIGIKELHVEPTRTYNENGDIATETPNPKEFSILMAQGDSFHVNEEQYNKLVELLTK